MKNDPRCKSEVSDLEIKDRLDSAEKALRQSEERFKLAMEATQDGLWDWNVETNDVYLSPNWSSLLGFNSNQFQLDIKAWSKLIHIDDKTTVFKAFLDCLNNHNDDFEVEYRIRIKNGDWMWILGRGKVVTRDRRGHAVRMVGTQTDITRLKQGEVDSATQADTLNIIFNSTPNILILVNTNGRIDKINRSGIDFSGKTEEELIGCLGGDALRCCHSFEGKGCGTTPDCTLCPIRTRVDKTFLTGTPHQEEEGDLTFFINGKEITLYFLISTVLLTVGRNKKVLLTITDISDLKRAEFERSSLKQQLYQSQKAMSIGTLAGGIAHDFNNILTAILGYTEMALYQNKQTPAIQEDLGEVIKAGHRAKELVKQILAFSRQSDTKRIPLQPKRIIREAIKMLRPSLPSTILIKQGDCQPTGSILADPTQLLQILLNICTNGYHAMENSGGTLDISLKETLLSNEDILCNQNIESGVFAQISIRDTGHGMDKETMEKIFDPYFTTKETGKGTGMGLSVVHGIVLSYGGFISLDSKPDKGTVFDIFLPIIKSDPLLAICTDEKLLTGTERILFVDDEEIIANLIKKMLEKLGYHVTAKTSSLDALETFQNHANQFDLVITDQTMPNMTGSDLAKTLLQIRADIPIILCTGYSTIMNEKKAKAIGIREFVTKPVSKNDIAILIRKILDSSQL